MVLAQNASSGHEPLPLYISIVSAASPLVLESISLLLLWIDLQNGCIPMGFHQNMLTQLLVLLVVESYLSAGCTFLHYCSSLQAHMMLHVGWVSACYLPYDYLILLTLQQNTLFWRSHCIEDGGRNFCNGKVAWVIFTNIYNHLQQINSNYNQNYL